MNAVTKERSIKILKRDHKTCKGNCCPSVPKTIPDKVEGWDKLEGTYEVSMSHRDLWMDLYRVGAFELRPHPTDTNYFYSYGELRDFLRNEITASEFFGNMFTKEHFEKVQELLAAVNVKLIKRSPKVSNLILTLLDVAVKRYPDNKERCDELYAQFNDRGDGRLSEYELVVSTEPHRIAGMSAYGDFSSCQDWSRKRKGDTYHTLTHQSWANLQDSTVGVAFIRRKDAQDPENEIVEDMLARALIRVVPLPNSRKMVYLHRLYGQAPYYQYLQHSFMEMAKELPEEFRTIFMHEVEYGIVGQNIKTEDGKYVSSHDDRTKVTVAFPSRISIKEKIEETCGHCRGRKEVLSETCSCCGGRGGTYTDCSCQQGDASSMMTLGGEQYCMKCYNSHKLWNTCEACEGRGGTMKSCEHCAGTGIHIKRKVPLPYNDHDDWFKFYTTKIEFKVPNAVYNEAPVKQDVEEVPHAV